MSFSQQAYDVLKDWQTLITGLIALYGAWLTIRALQRQSNEDADRRRRATRAMLPSTLDAVFLHFVMTIRWLRSTKEKAANLETGHYVNQGLMTGTSPRLDGGTSIALQKCVENLNPTEARYFSELLLQLQIHQSIVGDLADYFENHMLYHSKNARPVKNINEAIARSVQLAALTLRAFPYARDEREDIDPNLDIQAIQNAFRLCHLGEFENVEAWNMVTQPYLPKPGMVFSDAEMPSGMN